MFEKNIEINMLYDCYGQLLTNKQNQVLKLYYEEDYSLAEIGESLGISRQAVHDAIKKSEKLLIEYEEKLGVLKKFEDTESKINKIDGLIASVMKEHKEDEGLRKKLVEIRKVIDKVNE